jgi:hypothetical protein
VAAQFQRTGHRFAALLEKHQSEAFQRADWSARPLSHVA